MKKDKLLPSILIYSSEYWPFYDIIIKILRNKGYEVDLYLYSQKRDMFKYFAEVINLFQINFKKYDIVHAYFGTSGLIANFQRQVPVITTYCGSDLLGVMANDKRYNYIKSFLFKFASRLSYNLSVNTTTLSKKLEKELPNKEKNKIITLGVDTDHFSPINCNEARSKLGWEEEAIYILFPSEKYRSVKRYHLAKKLVSSIDLKMKTILISLDQPNMYNQIPLIMSASNLMIFVSKHEGSPNVIREAMCCNLPIFTFDVGDVKEQIEGVSNCFCAEQDDIESLSGSIIKFLRKNPFMRSDGREKVINCTWSNYVDSLTKLFNENAK